MLYDPRIGSCPVEIKYARGETLYKGALKEHQYNALMGASRTGIRHKLSDIGRIKQPFDAFIFKKSEAYLVIYYNIKPRAEVWAIPITKVPPDSMIKVELAREIGMLIVLNSKEPN